MIKLLFADYFQLFHRKSFYKMLLVIGGVYLFFFSFHAELYRPSDIAYWIENNLSMFYSTVLEVLHYRLQIPFEELLHMPFSEATEQYYYYAFELIWSEYSPVHLTAVFLSPFLFGTEYQNRNMQTVISQGYSRWRVFLSKSLQYYSVGVFVDLFVLFICTLGILGLDVLRSFPVEYLLHGICIRVYFVIGSFSVPFLLTMIAKDTMKASILNLAFLFLSTFWSYQASFPTFLQAMINVPAALRGVSFPKFEVSALTIQEWCTFLVVPSLVIIGSLFGSYFLFRKVELE